jgi:hypothetical protein
VAVGDPSLHPSSQRVPRYSHGATNPDERDRPRSHQLVGPGPAKLEFHLQVLHREQKGLRLRLRTEFRLNSHHDPSRAARFHTAGPLRAGGVPLEALRAPRSGHPPRHTDAAVYLPIKPRSTFIWDYAAAAILLREAGGRLTTVDGRAFLDIVPIEHREGWLAANDMLHTPVRKAVTDALGTLRIVD